MRHLIPDIRKRALPATVAHALRVELGLLPRRARPVLTAQGCTVCCSGACTGQCRKRTTRDRRALATRRRTYCTRFDCCPRWGRCRLRGDWWRETNSRQHAISIQQWRGALRTRHAGCLSCVLRQEALLRKKASAIEAIV